MQIISTDAIFTLCKEKKEIQPKMLYQVHLDNLVAKDNFYRKLNSILDLRFLYQATADYYGEEGQESIELYGEEVFMQLFKKVLSLCVDKGMVRRKRQAVDSGFVKANASLDSLQMKEITDDVVDYANELNQNKHASADVDENDYLIRPKYLSNHTHPSTTDPDARISVKPGKARQMNYFAQIAVDESNHVITGAGADFSDKRDSECLPRILDQTISNLQENVLTLEQILAGTAYSSGEVLKYCESKNMANQS